LDYVSTKEVSPSLLWLRTRTLCLEKGIFAAPYFNQMTNVFAPTPRGLLPTSYSPKWIVQSCNVKMVCGSCHVVGSCCSHILIDEPSYINLFH